MRKINTEFGVMEIDENDIIHFEQGLLGFDDVRSYVLINHDDQGMIMTLQTADGEVPQFVVLDPYVVMPKYNPVMSAANLNYFKGKKSNELKYLVIAVVKENYLETVVNLKSPIVIDPDTHMALQVILENPDYTMQYRVFADEGEK